MCPLPVCFLSVFSLLAPLESALAVAPAGMPRVSEVLLTEEEVEALAFPFLPEALKSENLSMLVSAADQKQLFRLQRPVHVCHRSLH